MEPSLRAASTASEPLIRDVTNLEIDDVIAAPWLPLRRPGRVLFVKPFERDGEHWVFVAYVTDTGMHDSTSFLAGEGVRLLYAADPTGLTYGRDPEADPQPAAGRVPPHFESGRGAPFDEPHPSWPTEQELKPWESLAPAAARSAESVKPIDPDSSMEAHYDAEADRPVACVPECGGGRQCRCQGGWS